MASNPQAAFNSLVQSNPDLNSAVGMINSQYGGDAKAAFYDQAKKKGIDPNSIFSMMQGMGLGGA